MVIFPYREAAAVTAFSVFLLRSMLSVQFGGIGGKI